MRELSSQFIGAVIDRLKERARSVLRFDRVDMCRSIEESLGPSPFHYLSYKDINTDNNGVEDSNHSVVTAVKRGPKALIGARHGRGKRRRRH